MKNKNLKNRFHFINWQLTLIFAFAVSISAQTTVFTYQGKLNDGSVAASGSYLLQFKLYDMVIGGAQIGSTLSDVAVTATQGVFTTQLDFGAPAFPGADRFIEIAVKKIAADPYTTLAPRQPITSAPYAIRAADSGKLGGVDASQYVTGSVVRSLNSLTDNVALAEGTNITITPAGNTLTIASTSGGVGGSGTTNSIPLWSGGTTLGNSVITQSSGNVGIGITPGVGFKLDVPGATRISPGGSGGAMRFGTPNAETGISMEGNNRADIRFDDSTLKLVVGPGGGSSPPSTNGIAITSSGNVGIGITSAGAKLDVNGQAIIRPGGSGGAIGFGNPNGETGLTINAVGTNRADIRFDNSTLKLLVGPPGGPPPSTNGIVINTSGDVGIGTINPGAKLHVSGGADGGVLSISTSGIGVRGIGNNFYGVQGESINNIGVFGSGGRFGVYSQGFLGVETLSTGGSTALCLNNSNEIARCGSSLRYKTNVSSFGFGLNVVNQLRPISFDWKSGGMKDVGFGAEDVAQINPLFVTYNVKGEVEGVKYDRLSVVFVNAFKEQQAQIEQQHQQIDGLKEIVCGLQPQAKICQ